MILNMMSGENLPDDNTGKSCRIVDDVCEVYYSKREIETGKHILFETGDDMVPNAITDRNGEVCLSMCKNCGRVESELISEPRCFYKTATTSSVLKTEEPATYECSLDVTYRTPNRGTLTETFILHGNAYLMNDSGKTINSYACDPYL